MQNQSTRRLMLLALTAAATCLSFASIAQTVPDHPRVNEVNARTNNQQDRVANGVANGTMTKGQAARDETRDANIAQRESADEAKHNGHLTKKEQTNLNHAQNRNSRKIYNQKH